MSVVSGESLENEQHKSPLNKIYLIFFFYANNAFTAHFIAVAAPEIFCCRCYGDAQHLREGALNFVASLWHYGVALDHPGIN